MKLIVVEASAKSDDGQLMKVGFSHRCLPLCRSLRWTRTRSINQFMPKNVVVGSSVILFQATVNFHLDGEFRARLLNGADKTLSGGWSVISVVVLSEDQCSTACGTPSYVCSLYAFFRSGN